jgi:hypothetical protein
MGLDTNRHVKNALRRVVRACGSGDKKLSDRVVTNHMSDRQLGPSNCVGGVRRIAQGKSDVDNSRRVIGAVRHGIDEIRNQTWNPALGVSLREPQGLLARPVVKEGQQKRNPRS